MNENWIIHKIKCQGQSKSAISIIEADANNLILCNYVCRRRMENIYHANENYEVICGHYIIH
jgi:hypothetical protein